MLIAGIYDAVHQLPIEYIRNHIFAHRIIANELVWF